MAIKVGDMVAWDKVPSGSVVRWRWDGHGNEFYWKRHNFVSSLVCTHAGEWRRPGGDNGSFAPEEPVTIIALDVPADATAEHLRELAEVFEVREALVGDDYLWCVVHEFLSKRGAATSDENMAHELHRAGWRPGMSAEDAARMLAEVHDD